MPVSEQDAIDVLGATVKERRGKPKPKPYVLIDTREQRCLRFPEELGVDCGAATLPAGDYSVRGFTSLIALERKSVSDLVGTLTKGRERFENELDLLAEYRWAAILVEGRRGDVEAGIYRSLATPQSIIGSLRAIWMRWKVPTFWLDSPEGVAREVAWYARRLHDKHLDLMEKPDATP
jgi:ERCC4-type nuclease